MMMPIYAQKASRYSLLGATVFEVAWL